MKKWLYVFLLFAVLPAGAVQQLNFNGFIADEANLLSEKTEYNLNMTLWDLQKKSGADIAVVTLPSLNGKTVEETALEIGRGYKIGSKEKNNGVVFLTALSERKMRIELGTGLEKKIKMSDLTSIRDNDILPFYKQSKYERGIARGTYMLADLVASAEGVNVIREGTCPERTNNSSSNTPWWVYLLAFILAPFSSRRRRYCGFSGGFGGGGGFGGCGCSGSW